MTIKRIIDLYAKILPHRFIDAYFKIIFGNKNTQNGASDHFTPRFPTYIFTMTSAEIIHAIVLKTSTIISSSEKKPFQAMRRCESRKRLIALECHSFCPVPVPSWIYHTGHASTIMNML